MGVRENKRAGKPIPKPGISGGLQLTLAIVVLGLAAIVSIKSALTGHTFHHHGTLVMMDVPAKKLTLQLADSGQQITFAWNADTEFLKGEQRLLVEALQPGAQVIVNYRASILPPLNAVRITLEVPGEHGHK